MINTESDIVLAFNMGNDLRKIAFNFVTLYGKFCNGVNNIFVSDNVSNLHLIEISEHKLSISYIETGYVPGYTEPAYCGYGATGEEESTYHSGYETQNEKALNIPFYLLLKPQEELIEWLKHSKLEWDAKKAEEKRQKEIAYHKSELEKLVAASKI